jgi:hypothetical protein
MDGWVGGWMGGKAGLRIAYSNQKEDAKADIILYLKPLLNFLLESLLCSTQQKCFFIILPIRHEHLGMCHS